MNFSTAGEKQPYILCYLLHGLYDGVTVRRKAAQGTDVVQTQLEPAEKELGE